MAQFLEIPGSRLQADVLQAILEDFASRDGTDYGATEYTLGQKVSSLRGQLESGKLLILYDTEGEHWDLVSRERAGALIGSPGL